MTILNPGGTLIVVAENHKQGTYNKLQRPVMKVLKASNLQVDDHRALFLWAGYTDVRIFEDAQGLDLRKRQETFGGRL